MYTILDFFLSDHSEGIYIYWLCMYVYGILHTGCVCMYMVYYILAVYVCIWYIIYWLTFNKVCMYVYIYIYDS